MIKYLQYIHIIFNCYYEPTIDEYKNL